MVAQNRSMLAASSLQYEEMHLLPTFCATPYVLTADSIHSLSRSHRASMHSRMNSILLMVTDCAFSRVMPERRFEKDSPSSPSLSWVGVRATAGVRLSCGAFVVAPPPCGTR